jgi:thiol-disulfide isomerase/thioredoxin
MRWTALIVIFCFFMATANGQDRSGAAPPAASTAAARFDAMLHQSLAALSKAGSYAVDVDTTWEATGQSTGSHRSHYRLVWQGGKYRVEVQSHGAQTLDLVCVNDGANVTTYFPARKLYSRHPTSSREGSLEANTMLAMSLHGSALDILLAQDVGRAVHAQASGIKDLGEVMLDGKKTHRFSLVWAGANTDVWFAAEGAPLLVKFTRTANVAGMMGDHELSSSAKFQWHLGQVPPPKSFELAIPADAHQVKEIYDALAGHEASTNVGQPLPALKLAKLDGSDVTLVAASDKKATVLIFWATWCASSIEGLPALHKLVDAYQHRGVAFYAINVGEQPGAVRRFTEKHPLVSTVLLDPRSTASTALRIGELPAVAVIGPDNTVRGVIHGQAKTLEGQLTTQLDALLTGSAGTTARAPASTTPGRTK